MKHCKLYKNRTFFAIPIFFPHLFIVPTRVPSTKSQYRFHAHTFLIIMIYIWKILWILLFIQWFMNTHTHKHGRLARVYMQRFSRSPWMHKHTHTSPIDIKLKFFRNFHSMQLLSEIGEQPEQKRTKTIKNWLKKHFTQFKWCIFLMEFENLKLILNSFIPN